MTDTFQLSHMVLCFVHILLLADYLVEFPVKVQHEFVLGCKHLELS